jgi:hypothetical protein
MITIKYYRSFINSRIKCVLNKNIAWFGKHIIPQRYYTLPPEDPYKLQYISDIHLEYLKQVPMIKPIAPHLALLGDIGNPFLPNYHELLKYASYNWEKIFLLTGNHEYWQENKTMQEVDEHIQSLSSKYKNIFFLNNSAHMVTSQYMILGTTLWSYIRSEPKSLFGDDMSILTNERKNIRWNNINSIYKHNTNWLIDQLNVVKSQNILIHNDNNLNIRNNININDNNIDNDKPIKCIILTHHLPSYQLIHSKYQKSIYQDRFASNLEDLITEPVAAWLCGHSHIIMNIIINGIPCAINAYGYSKQNPNRTLDSINQVLTLDQAT